MTIDEIIELLKNPPESGLEPTIYDDLSSAHLNDLSIRDAKVQELEGLIAERDATIATLKSQNYDLVMKVDAGKSVDEEPVDENNDDDGDIDSLFKDEDE